MCGSNPSLGPSPAACTTCSDESTYLKKQDYHGKDFKHFKGIGSAAECCAKCSSNSKCKYWTVRMPARTAAHAAAHPLKHKHAHADPPARPYAHTSHARTRAHNTCTHAPPHTTVWHRGAKEGLLLAEDGEHWPRASGQPRGTWFLIFRISLSCASSMHNGAGTCALSVFVLALVLRSF